MWEPGNGGCDNPDGGHERVGAAVVPGVDTPPVFELADYVVDLVTLAIEGCFMQAGHFAIGPSAASAPASHLYRYVRQWHRCGLAAKQGVRKARYISGLDERLATRGVLSQRIGQELLVLRSKGL